MRLVWLALFGVVASACSADAGYTDYMDDDIPAGNQCTTTGTVFETETESCSGSDTGDDSTTTTTTTGGDDECVTSSDCQFGMFCGATFDTQRGPFVCLAECIGDMDETLWCADFEACCDDDALCTERGYCVVPGESTTGMESSTGTGTDTGSGTGTGSETGATTGTGG